MGKMRPQPKNSREVLSTLLRQIRKDKGLTQMDLANRLGHPQSYVSKYETGERRLDLIELVEVSEATGIELEEFVKIFKSLVNDSK